MAGEAEPGGGPDRKRHAITAAVIGVTLPLLKRMTGPDNARFE